MTVTQLTSNRTFTLSNLSFEDVELLCLALEYHSSCEKHMVDRQQELIEILDGLNNYPPED